MIMRTICTFVCLVMLIITGISFIFIINPKRTKQIQSSFATILSEQADIFTFDKIEDGIVNIRDFQTTGVVAFAEASPFSLLSVGRHDIYGNDTQVRQDYLSNCTDAISDIIAKL